MLPIGISCVQSATDTYVYVLVDIEDSSEAGEDSKSEAKLKEYNLDRLNGLERKLSLVYSIDYLHYNTLAISSVTLDIATPPPRS